VRSEPIRSSNLGTRTQATRRRVFWAAAWRHHSGTSHWHNNNTCRDLLAAWNRDRMVAICNNHLGYTYRRRGLVQVWPEILNYLSFSIHKFTQNRLDFFFWFCLLSCSDFLRTLPRACAIALLAPAFSANERNLSSSLTISSKYFSLPIENGKAAEFWNLIFEPAEVGFAQGRNTLLHPQHYISFLESLSPSIC